MGDFDDSEPQRTPRGDGAEKSSALRAVPGARGEPLEGRAAAEAEARDAQVHDRAAEDTRAAAEARAAVELAPGDAATAHDAAEGSHAAGAGDEAASEFMPIDRLLRAELEAADELDGLDGPDELDELDELDSSDSGFDEDDELAATADLLEEAAADPNAPPRERLLLEVHRSFTYDDTAPDGSPLVAVDVQFADEAYNFLVVHGPVLFHAKYRMQEGCSAPRLLAALGFRLPAAVAASEQYSEQDFDFALQIASRLAPLRRRRLPRPRTLAEVVAAIRAAKNILVVTGAGISTSLGIPDFRSDNGLYAQLRHLGLGDPQEVFDIRLFREDPSIFYSVARKILPDPALYRGTPTHQFIKLLADHGKLLRNYTQNIDNIEHHVGLDPAQVVQCHGSFGSAHCVTCDFAVPNGEDLFPAIRAGEVPRCPQCAERTRRGKRRAASDDDDDSDGDGGSFGVLKPDITFFGESLPHRFDRLLLDEGDAVKCDLVLCMGTSLKVAPVSEIVKVVRRGVPQIFVSKTPVSHVVFEATFLGSCDDTVELLAQELGWSLEHPMSKRPANMPATEFPQGTISSSDGVFTFEAVKTEGSSPSKVTGDSADLTSSVSIDSAHGTNGQQEQQTQEQHIQTQPAAGQSAEASVVPPIVARPRVSSASGAVPSVKASGSLLADGSADGSADGPSDGPADEKPSTAT